MRFETKDEKGFHVTLKDHIDATTTWISKETKSKLDKLGNKNDTYEDIILRLLEGKHSKPL